MPPPPLPSPAEVERAIAAVERALGARLCLIDPQRLLSAIVPAQRSYHDHAFCRHIIQASGGRCAAFESGAAFTAARERGRGFLKRCHGGVVEYCAPLHAEGMVVAAIMTGPWRVPGRDADETLVTPRLPLDPAARALLASVPEAGAERLADAQALVDCLAQWLSPLLAGAALASGEVNRRWQIEHLIGRRFMQALTVDEVASHLGLSTSRTRHMVRELFATTVADLVRQARIAHAQQLLSRSELNLSEIATRCGVGNAGYLHRLFQRVVGMTPNAYRRAHAVLPSPPSSDLTSH